ncbi:MAG: histidinol-phosphate transaminase [Chloroflexi bacterium]|nr:histidinol-phosphate transaminase [Chloroflexota bacterium]MCL5025384.1 histidinol-phosphate transaminase [Chloroflexota bacterium]
MRTSSIERLLRADILEIPDYPAPETPAELSARTGIPEEHFIKLDQSENPHGCSQRVRSALARFDRYHIYPDGTAADLRRHLGEYVGMPADQIVVGNGSDELIDMTLGILIEPGDRVIVNSPTFAYYASSIGAHAATLVDVPRRGDFSIDVDAVLSTIDDRTKAIIIASPNNPTGNLTPIADIRRLLEGGPLVAIDEAYAEFAGTSVLPLMAEHDNLVVIRTFSKWAGLAGLRLGYGIYPPALMPHILKVKPPFNTNIAAQVAGRVSLEDQEYLLSTVRLIVNERERLFRRLSEIEFLKPYPSAANFILCQVLRGEARDLHQKLEANRILVRYFDKPGLRNFIRISIGTPEECDELVRCLRAIGQAYSMG